MHILFCFIFSKIKNHYDFLPYHHLQSNLANPTPLGQHVFMSVREDVGL